ncbi:unnamed protein product [Brassica rapa]|uniref:Uncharacterized protein n=1 Tax=Brassica campestris TaxID=3711 RepID=A0A8D9HUV1_BRACM|nr:unnamed protein product [Brassica rapa]
MQSLAGMKRADKHRENYLGHSIKARPLLQEFIELVKRVYVLFFFFIFSHVSRQLCTGHHDLGKIQAPLHPLRQKMQCLHVYQQIHQ